MNNKLCVSEKFCTSTFLLTIQANECVYQTQQLREGMTQKIKRVNLLDLNIFDRFWKIPSRGNDLKSCGFYFWNRHLRKKMFLFLLLYVKHSVLYIKKQLKIHSMCL